VVKYFDHGGGVARAARELGLPPASILDFSASINPLGIPPEVLRTAREALDEAVHYPEIDASSLTEALAEYHGIPVENILPGSGSTELLYLFPRVLQPRRALLVTPAFTEYERSLNQAGTALEIYPLVPETGFHLDPERLLQHLEPDIDLILLANPGNPMGSTIPPETIAEIAHAVREQALVAVDEAFVDFCPQFSVLPQLLRHGNLYVFRSLTKFYAIPGLRAGYLAGPARGISHLKAAREPWALSTPALAAAAACLTQADYRRKTLDQLPSLRGSLAEGLAALGLTVFPSSANYLLARLEEKGRTAAGLAEGLKPRGILIRDCGNFPPLDGRYLRVAVRSEPENRRLLEAMEDVLR
jgi:threonine-phosphate decarboxylase